MTILEQYPQVRKPLYAAFALVGVALGAVQTAYLVSEAGQPTWLTITLAVFGYLATAFGVTAASNTPAPERVIDEHGQAWPSLVTVVLIVLTVVLIAWLVGL